MALFVILAPSKLSEAKVNRFCARSPGSSPLPAADPALLPCLVWLLISSPQIELGLLWFLLSCILMPLLFIVLCGLMVDRLFVDIPLDSLLDAKEPSHES
jgi:uncharacterized membrane protein YhdT